MKTTFNKEQKTCIWKCMTPHLNPESYSWAFLCRSQGYCNCQGLAQGVLDSDLFQIQTLQHPMRMRDSIMFIIPKCGDTIWGGLDWLPKEGYSPSKRGKEKMTLNFPPKMRQQVKSVKQHMQIMEGLYHLVEMLRRYNN